MKTSLSDRIRSNSEAAPWVIDAVVQLEQEVENLKAHRELCTENLLKGYETGKTEERTYVVDFLRACVTDPDRSDDNLDYALAVIERGAHRREEKG